MTTGDDEAHLDETQGTLTDEMSDDALADALVALAEHGRPLLAPATCSLLRVCAHRLRRPVAHEPDGPLLLTIGQAAEHAQISRSTAYGLVASGSWPIVRIGRSVRVPYAGLVKWIATAQER